MNGVLWALQWLVALVVIICGLEALRSPNQMFTVVGGRNAGRIVGFSGLCSPSWSALQIIAGLALILPGALGVLTMLTPAAATYLALFEMGEAIVDRSRGRMAFPAGRILVLLLTVLIAVGRFGPWPL